MKLKTAISAGLVAVTLALASAGALAGNGSAVGQDLVAGNGGLAWYSSIVSYFGSFFG